MMIIMIMNYKDPLDQTPLSDEQNKASEDQRLRTKALWVKIGTKRSSSDDQKKMVKAR